MKVINNLEQFSPGSRGGALCIGNFDGVHIGHQHLLGETRKLAKSVGGPTVALTLQPHPMRLLNPEKMPEPICRMEDKLSWLERAGVDIVIIEPTRAEILELEPQEFLDKLLLKYIEPKWIVEGQSFRFGLDRAGDVNLLRELGAKRNFQVRVLDPVQADLGRDGEFTVSSSLIRELLRSGLVAQAAQCLGRPHVITGIVSRGSGRGRKMNLPTANLEQIEQLTPAEGVYAGCAWLGKKCYLSAISVGTAVTFDHGERLVEAILLDFNQDIYDQQIHLEFYLHLRQQLRFSSVAELAEHIRADCEKIRQLCEKGEIQIPPTEPNE